jgi:hypothetical protein
MSKHQNVKMSGIKVKMPKCKNANGFMIGTRIRQLLHDNPVEIVTYAAEQWTALCIEKGMEAARIVDAATLLDKSEYKKLKKQGVPVRQLADFLRCLQIDARGGGVLVDGDMLALLTLPNIRIEAPQWGHWCGTLRKPRSSYRCLRQNAILEQEIRFLATPQDWVCAATPVAFPPKSPILKQWIGAMRERFSAKTFDKSHCGNMKLMSEAFTAWGCEFAYLKPHVFTPFDYGYGHKEAVILADKVHLFDTKAALSKSYGVNGFWSSMAGKDTSGQKVDACALGRLKCIEEGSAWHIVRQRALTRSSRKRCYEKMAPEALTPGGASTPPASSGFLWPSAPPILQRSPDLNNIRHTYELLGLRGEGTYGKVYVARNRLNAADVVVKIAAGSEIAEAFLLEYCAHQNVVKLCDKFASPWLNITVMEICDCTLWRFMDFVVRLSC